MSLPRVDYSIVLANATQGLSVYDHMRGLAIHARALNPGTGVEEQGRGQLLRVQSGVADVLRSFTIGETIVDGPSPGVGSASLYVAQGMMAFPDLEHAENALAHAEALAQQGAVLLTGAVMAGWVPELGRVPRSHGALHECQHEVGGGCVVSMSFDIPLPQAPDGVNWVVGEVVVASDVRIYEGVSYICLQGHMTQLGWEPPNVPALWAVT